MLPPFWNKVISIKVSGVKDKLSTVSTYCVDWLKLGSSNLLSVSQSSSEFDSYISLYMFCMSSVPYYISKKKRSKNVHPCSFRDTRFNQNLRLLPTCLVMAKDPLTFDWSTINYKMTNKVVWDDKRITQRKEIGLFVNWNRTFIHIFLPKNCLLTITTFFSFQLFFPRWFSWSLRRRSCIYILLCFLHLCQLLKLWS